MPIRSEFRAAASIGPLPSTDAYQSVVKPVSGKDSVVAALNEKTNSRPIGR